MSHPFDPGYAAPPFRALCEDYPDATVYPPEDFRVEWGPIFHRGRLDGSARVLVLGQDPAAHESISRRILVGEAGQRVQGLLARLGIERSYVMVNTFLYSVYGQGGGERHRNDAAIAAYRHRWLDALIPGRGVEVVIALGGLADHAWGLWKATPTGAASTVAYARVTHPTQPESSSGGDRVKLAAAIAAMLRNWNAALDVLHPAVKHPDTPRPLTHYGEAFAEGDLAPLPEEDLPAGVPAWMRGLKAWARRTGDTPEEKRRTLTVTVPKGVLP
ncbi:uracil-DNA glycosylase family protein [Myxococcaceae bacterium GXIMD 01537]